MSEVLKIIDDSFRVKIHETTFNGNVYLNNGSNLEIERNVHNRLLNKFNTAITSYPDKHPPLDLSTNLLLVFVIETFEDNSDNWSRMDRNYYLSTIINERGFLTIWSEETEGYDKKPDHLDVIFYENIDFVELLEDKSDNNFYFRFYLKNETHHFDMFSNRFGAYDLDTCLIILDLLQKIISNINDTVNNSIQQYDELTSQIEEAGNNKDYEKVFELLDYFKDIYEVEDISNENTFSYYITKTTAFISIEQYENALKTIDGFIIKFNEINEVPPYAFELKGEILLKTNNFLSATNFLAHSVEGYEEESHKIDALALKEESYSKLKEVFLEVPYNQRKLIFIGEDIYATQSNGMIVLKKNDLPWNVKFPVGHPHVNEVYTCHPHKQDFYLPLKSYSEELFLDRINEFSWLLQCLGAATLEISSSKSEFSDKTVRSNSEVDAQIDYKLSGAKLNIQGENTENNSFDGKMNIAKKQVFKPSKLPFVPDDLVWYPSNTSWQRLAHQRLNGSMMMHNELISSSQSETVSTHELKQIEAELKLLLPKIGVKYNNEEQVNISSIKKYESLVHVEFADVNDLLQLEQNIKAVPTSVLNSNSEEYYLNLEKYREEVLFMLEDDGVIDEYERNLLNRKMRKYCITEEDARAIENELATSGFSENELNYIQELKELLEDGEISDMERKILDRYAKKFNVVIEVQKKIDAIFII